MKIVLLCPGPSLAKYDGGEGADLTVGVNRAATKFHCDVWACGDPPLFDDERRNVIGSPILFTSDVLVGCMGNGLRPGWPGDVIRFEDLYESPDGREAHAYQWTLFTATNALMFCASKKPDLIRVFGADHRGKEDFDGKLAGENREEERWRLERQIWANLVELLATRGIKVERVQP